MVRPFLQLSVLLGCAVASAAAIAPAFRDPNRPVSERVDDLLARMTLEEKAGQMSQFVGLEHLRTNAGMQGRPIQDDDSTAIYPTLSIARIESMISQGLIGSFLHVYTAAEANRLQALANRSRLGIPLIIGVDAPHGNGLVHGATVYPTALSLAATFDPALVTRIARETAAEVRAQGAHWTFAPNVDVVRDLRWGRTGETFGEDPWLVAQLGMAAVRGYQGEDLSHPDAVAACLKHLVGGGEPLNGSNFAPTEVSEHTLRTVYWPPFLAAIRAGAATTMAAHHEYNGLPCHASPWLLRTLLRDEAGFTGVVVSDWLDVSRLETLHRIAASPTEAVQLAVMAGIDLNMHGPGFAEPLVAAVQSGAVPESRVDEAVRAILQLKFRLGLFERAWVDENEATRVLFQPTHQETALLAARRSLILLKNEGDVLPIDPNRHRRIFVTGPLVDSPALLGDWVSAQPSDRVTTVLEGLRAVAPPTCTIIHGDVGTSVLDLSDRQIAAATTAAAGADVIVAVVGESAVRFDERRTSGENKDRPSLEFPGRQLALLQALQATGRPLVVVTISGRPIASPWTVEHVPALLSAGEPGSFGGQAIAEALFGLVNPSGRLPVSIPRTAGHLPVHYNHKPTHYHRPYITDGGSVLFPFGHGLSYTTFRYTNLRVGETVHSGGTVDIELDVTNTGPRAGDETVLAFVRDETASVTVPVRELKGVARVKLAPGETQRVHLKIRHADLALIDSAMRTVVEPGRFRVYVGELAGAFNVVP